MESVTSGCWTLSLWVSHTYNLHVSVGTCLALHVLGCRPGCPYLPIFMWATGHFVSASGDWVSVSSCLGDPVSFLFTVVHSPPFYPAYSFTLAFFLVAPLLGILLEGLHVNICAWRPRRQAKCVTALADMAQRGLSLCASS